METKSEKQGQSLIDVGEAKSLKQKALTSLHPLPPGVNPDLAEERSRPCSFSQTELTELIDGGRQKTEERKRLEEIFLDSRQVSKGSTRIKVFKTGITDCYGQEFCRIPQVPNVQLETLGSVERHKVGEINKSVLCICVHLFLCITSFLYISIYVC